MLFRVYSCLSWLIQPFCLVILVFRLVKRKETLQSISQKMGRYDVAKNAKPLIWVHAASVGEAKSSLSLLRYLDHKNPELQLLLTTSTLSSYRYLNAISDLPCLHQFLVLDTPQNVSRFYRHWQPILGIFIDSELWPNLLMASKKYNCRLVLFNARLSLSSWAKWRRLRTFFQQLIARFSCIVPTTAQDQRLILDLGANPDSMLPPQNLKQFAPPLAYDKAMLQQLKRSMPRPNALFASTHDDEEKQILQAFKGSGVHIMIAPRHPDRASEIARIAKRLGYQVYFRTQTLLPARSDDRQIVYIIDVMGELGLWYRFAQVVFVGGSFTDTNGHNVIEPAQLGKAIFVGPKTSNFSAAIAHLTAHHAIVVVKNIGELKHQMLIALESPYQCKKLGQNALKACIMDSSTLEFYRRIIIDSIAQ